MEKTRDGYLIPEEGNEEEEIEAINHNTLLAGEKWRNLTQEQRHEQVKKQAKFQEEEKIRKAPRGYAVGGLKLDNYIDNVEQFWTINPFFYDKTQMFWIWNKTEYKYEITDETTILILIDEELGFGGQTVTSKIKNNYLEAFKRVGRKHLPLDAPKTWIQFKNKIIDIKDNTEHEANPNYFITNPIPWNLSNTEETPIIDNLFTDWQGKNKNTLYEVIAYCLLPDYPIHIILAMIGTGRNGKTQYQKIIERFLGQDNITSAELDSLVKERFESAKLYKKLVCTMGETNFGMMSQTSLLKKLCGGDLISYEYKNKMPFTGHNYAKIIINTNSLPASNDTTEGFYRRWLILNWENNFEESGHDIVDMIPDEEYSALARKSIRVLSELLERGRFNMQGSIDERKHKYILASNPITLFLQERCQIGDSFYVKAKDLYHEYLKYLQEKKRRTIKRKEFNQILAEEGYQAEHKQKRLDNGDWENSYWFEGLRILPILPIIPSFYLSFPNASPEVESRVNQEKKEKDFVDNSILGFESVSLMIEESSTRSISKHTLVSYGVLEETIQKWINQGLIFEQPLGTIRLV